MNKRMRTVPIIVILSLLSPVIGLFIKQKLKGAQKMHKSLAIFLIFLSLTFLVSCGLTRITDEERLKGINAAGKKYDMQFVEVSEVPAMPEGCVLVFNADVLHQIKTEIYFKDNTFLSEKEMAQQVDNSQFNAKTGLYVCQEKKIMVIFRSTYRFELFPELAEFSTFGFFYQTDQKEAILYFKNLNKWTIDEKKEYRKKFLSYFPDKALAGEIEGTLSFSEIEKEGIFKLAQYLFDETHNESSFFAGITKGSRAEDVEIAINVSLGNTQTFDSSDPDSLVGNRVDMSSLPKDVWKVYSLHKGHLSSHSLGRIQYVKDEAAALFKND